jgi:putative transposase
VAPQLLDAVPAATLGVADAAHDSDALREQLRCQGTQDVIPNNPTRKRHHPFDATACAT